MELLATGGMITLFITVFTFFYKLVIQPLAKAIQELKDILAELQRDLRDENEKRTRLDIRLAVVEEKIENLEGRFWKNGKNS